MSVYIRYPSTSATIPTYANFAALPASANDGSAAITLDTDTLYIYNLGSTTWLPVAGPGSVFTIGTINTGTPNANGAQIVSNALILQYATATVPGYVSIATQTFAGNKTFTGTIAASNLSGTNTGDVTIGTANGLSLAAQVLSLGTSSGSTTGALTSTDWTTFNNKVSTTRAINTTAPLTGGGDLSADRTIAIPAATGSVNGYLTSADWTTFNGKQAAGNYITALTTDVVAAGPGSVAATIQPNVVSNSKLAQMATLTLKGNNTGGTANALDLTVSQVNTMLGTVTNPMTTLGDTIYGGASGAVTRLAGDTSNTRKFLRELSVAGTATAPAWDTLVAGDIPNLPASIITSGTLAKAQGGTAQDNSSLTFPASGTIPAITPNNHGLIVSGSGAAATVIAPDASTTKVLLSGGASADPTWGAVPAAYATTAKTANYTLATTDTFTTGDATGGAFTFTLPAASAAAGKVYYIKRIDNTIANAITIARAGGDTIDGATSITLNTIDEMYALISDGVSSWWIIGHYILSSTNNDLTFSTQGFGTLADSDFRYQRIGNRMFVRGYFKVGTLAALQAYIQLPTNITIDSTEIGSAVSAQKVGFYSRVDGNIVSISNNTDLTGQGVLFYDGTINNQVFFTYQSQSSAYNKVNGTTLCSANDYLTFDFDIPVTGWMG